MECERLIDESHVKRIRLFKCPNLKQQKSGLITFRTCETKHTGKPGTVTESIGRWEHDQIGFGFDSKFIDSLFPEEPMEEEEEEDVVYQSIAHIRRFGFKSRKVLAKEVRDIMRSCYRFDEATYWGMHPDYPQFKNDFFLVVVVEVCLYSATEDYFWDKLLMLNDQGRVLHKDDQDGVENSCVRVDDEDDDMTKESVGSSDMDYNYIDDDDDDDDDDEEDYGVDDDGVSKDNNEQAKDDDDYDDYGDDEEHGNGMEEDERSLDNKSEMNIIEWIKLWNEVPDDMLIQLHEVKPLMKIQELEVQLMDDNTFKQIVADNPNATSVEGLDCSICLNSFMELGPKSTVFPWYPRMNCWQIVSLNCGHIFHRNCVFDWLSKTVTCPLCRSVNMVFV